MRVSEQWEFVREQARGRGMLSEVECDLLGDDPMEVGLLWQVTQEIDSFWRGRDAMHFAGDVTIDQTREHYELLATRRPRCVVALAEHIIEKESEK